MRRRLSKILLSAALCAVPLAGCKSDSPSSKVAAPDQIAQSDTSGGEAPTDTPTGVTTTAEPTTVKTEEAPAPEPEAVAAADSKDADKSAAPGRSRSYAKRGKRIAGAPMRIAQPPMESTGNTEDYTNYGTNPMVDTAKDHLSTFAIDVDTASYAIARTKIRSGQMPPSSAVRVEEFVNYFNYHYAGPQSGDAPFAVHLDAAPSPFDQRRHILRVGVQAKPISLRERKNANLVFLVDVSGSMGAANKLPLAQRAMRVLVDNLKDGDTISLVTYAGSTRVVLEPTGLDKRDDILAAIENLRSGGGTGMSSGMELAYDMAAKNLRPNSISRVIVLSDGDANIGRTSHAEMLETIAGKVKEGVTMTTVGFGMGNYKDTMMEQLANKGNGNYFYIDTISEARKVFQEQLGGTLEVVAKDVKIQVDFDKTAVKRYRLVGYENRDVADRDFRNDKVDAGEIGAGHSVTAVYEVELASAKPSGTLATVRLRAKKPRGTKASEWTFAMNGESLASSFEKASADFRFAAAVMAGAEILRGSEHAKSWKLSKVIAIAAESAGQDSSRVEFVNLMKRARSLSPKLATR